LSCLSITTAALSESGLVGPRAKAQDGRLCADTQADTFMPPAPPQRASPFPKQIRIVKGLHESVSFWLARASPGPRSNSGASLAVQPPPGLERIAKSLRLSFSPAPEERKSPLWKPQKLSIKPLILTGHDVLPICAGAPDVFVGQGRIGSKRRGSNTPCRRCQFGGCKLSATWGRTRSAGRIGLTERSPIGVQLWAHQQGCAIIAQPWYDMKDRRTHELSRA
jgi:hypothetical protein